MGISSGAAQQTLDAVLTRLLNAVAPASEAVLGRGVDRLVAERLDAWRQQALHIAQAAMAKRCTSQHSRANAEHLQACQAHADRNLYTVLVHSHLPQTRC